jgi:hypothetical protein
MTKAGHAMTAAVFDCQACGACCGPSTDYPTYVDVDENDLARLTPHWRKAHVFEDDDRTQGSIATKYDPKGNVVCVALRGTIRGRVSCGIYGRRPRLCRIFVVGSKDCLAARQEHGLDGGCR